MPELDPNAIVSAVATHIYDSISKSASAAVGSKIKKLKWIMSPEFESYSSSILKRTSYVKTIVHPDEAVHIDDLYVPLSYLISNEDTTDTSIVSAFESDGRVLIVGTAGGGKSMFIKKMCADLLRARKTKVPIFYELRYLNGLENRDLYTVLFDSIKMHVSSLTEEIFSSMLNGNKFGLVLYGFDEIDHDFRRSVGRDIERISQKYPNLSIAITSRPEDDLLGLNAFSVYHARRMSKEQALSLIGKIEYDYEKKEAFIAQVESDLYNQHREFLSIPLMVSMMLLTYSYYSEIPAKIHIFYRQAFDVLCQRHDRSKGVYTRKSYSGLSPDVFKDIFSHFCASTYISNRYELDDIECNQHISESIRYCGVISSYDDVKHDMIESTCLLQRDGINITFVHRSFQEYFTAVFISRLSDQEANLMIQSLVNRAASDKVLEMLKDIDQDFLERAWVVPTIDRLIAMSDMNHNGSGVYGLIPSVFDHLTIDDEKTTAGNTESLRGNEAMALWMLYGIMWKADEYRDPEEPLLAFTNVSNDAKLEKELSEQCSEFDMYLRYKESGKIGVLDQADPGTIISLEHTSEQLRAALLVDKAIGREIKAWQEIREKIVTKSMGKSASLASILKAAENESWDR